jgi:hypothetical protein
MVERAEVLSGVSHAPFSPQLSGRLTTESSCAGRDLAKYHPSDLRPNQARNAAVRGCRWVILRECSAPTPLKDSFKNTH